MLSKIELYVIDKVREIRAKKIFPKRSWLIKLAFQLDLLVK